MKTILVLISLIAAITVFAQQSTPRPIPRAISVNFASKGNGIDYVAYQATMDFISVGMQDETITKVTSKRWGREGEVTVCFELQDPITFSEKSQDLKLHITANRDESKLAPVVSVLLKCE